MAARNIDEYIENAAPFAKPILNHLRKLVQENCPGVEEKIKWGMAAFDYKGPFASMASFKEHASFGFWKAKLMKDADRLLDNQSTGMGHLGRITSLKDLPPDSQIIKWLSDAMALNDEGVKIAIPKTEKRELSLPDEFAAALNENKIAKEVFDKASYSFRKEYIMWVTGAKTAGTRQKRMAQAVEWISEGKGRNWKYEKG